MELEPHKEITDNYILKYKPLVKILPINSKALENPWKI